MLVSDIEYSFFFLQIFHSAQMIWGVCQSISFPEKSCLWVRHTWIAVIFFTFSPHFPPPLPREVILTGNVCLIVYLFWIFRCLAPRKVLLRGKAQVILAHLYFRILHSWFWVSAGRSQLAYTQNQLRIAPISRHPEDLLRNSRNVLLRGLLCGSVQRGNVWRNVLLSLRVYTGFVKCLLILFHVAQMILGVCHSISSFAISYWGAGNIHIHIYI